MADPDRTMFCKNILSERCGAGEPARLRMQPAILLIGADRGIKPAANSVRRKADAPGLAAVPKCRDDRIVASGRSKKNRDGDVLDRICVSCSALKRSFKPLPFRNKRGPLRGSAGGGERDENRNQREVSDTHLRASESISPLVSSHFQGFPGPKEVTVQQPFQWRGKNDKGLAPDDLQLPATHHSPRERRPRSSNPGRTWNRWLAVAMSNRTWRRG